MAGNNPTLATFSPDKMFSGLFSLFFPYLIFHLFAHVIRQKFTRKKMPLHTRAGALICIEDSFRRTPALKTADSIDTLELTDALKLLTFIHICKETSIWGLNRV